MTLKTPDSSADKDEHCAALEVIFRELKRQGRNGWDGSSSAMSAGVMMLEAVTQFLHAALPSPSLRQQRIYAAQLGVLAIQVLSRIEPKEPLP